MSKYIRIKSGEANFLLSERFDDVEKAANPNAQGELVECKVTGIKLDFTKVKKEKDGKAETKLSEAARKHEAYLATMDKANKLKRDSFRLIWKVERAKEQLMR